MNENILDEIKKVFSDERSLTSSYKEEKKTLPKYNLKSPPGLVGEVTSYINSQCRYPREHLAVISALITVGNIGGLNHKLENSKISANLFAFAVAGSATGKEAVLQSVNDLHIAAGISAAVHGSIKSEQEIIRNLIRNQAAYYNIDELGILFKKINLSQKSGGASYMQGVFGTLMAAYSKSSGHLLLSGDLKEDIKTDLNREYAALNKKLDDGEDAVILSRMDAIKTALSNIDKGLKNPFLSVLGFSTPTTFNENVSFEQVTNGFIGRSIIINEPDTNPKRKRNFIPDDMPESLINQLVSLRSTGNSDKIQSTRIEATENFNIIETDHDAQLALEDCADWFEDHAEKETERTGFEAVVRRGYEMLEKVSFILSFGSNTRTLEHVEWAFEYIKRDIEYKTLLAYSNVKEKTDPVESMAAKIMSIIDQNGITIGKIANRYRSKKELVNQAIDMLERKDRIRIEEKEMPHVRHLVKVVYKV